MKSNILLLSLLSLISNVQAARDVNTSNLVTRACCKKATCAPTVITAGRTIDESGPYCLGKDILGVITIAADNVTLDLNSHEVDGNGAPAAIVSVGNFNTIIHNGSVTNAGSLGISLSGCHGAHIENVQVHESNNAITLNSCMSSSLTHINAYSNLNTSGPVILVNGCENIQLSHVHANDNVKQFPVVTSSADVGIGIITVFDSSSVTVSDSTINDNVRNNTNVRFAPFFTYLSKDINLNNVQINTNAIEADIRGFAPVLIRQSESVVLDGCYVNGNTAVTTSNIFRPIYALDTINFSVKNSQINDNFLGSTITSPAGATVDLSCIYTFYSVIFVNENNLITNCQISNNKIGSVNAPLDSQLTGIFINAISAGPVLGAPYLVGRTTITHCQVNDNVINTNNNLSSATVGIILDQVVDALVDSCAVNNNSGGTRSVNIYARGLAQPDFGVASDVVNVTISNCIANNSKSTGTTGGIIVSGAFDAPSDIRAVARNCRVTNCQANNCSAALDGSGILVGDAIGCSVINCQANNNSHNGIVLGLVLPPFDENPVTDDVSIIGCTANNNGSIGYKVTAEGVTTNCLIQDCIALDNDSIGFFHGNTPLTCRYLGNYAKDNAGINYDISGGAIQLFTLDNLGNYTHVSGDPVHFSSLINIDGNPL